MIASRDSVVEEEKEGEMYSCKLKQPPNEIYSSLCSAPLAYFRAPQTPHTAQVMYVDEHG